MSEEEIIKLCKETFFKNIKEYIKSETIFMYVDNLEKENKKQKEVLDKIRKKVNQYDFISGYYYDNYGEDNDTLKENILELLEELK